MSEEGFGQFIQNIAGDSQEAHRLRVEKERRMQNRASRTRRILRWSFFSLFAVGLGLIYLDAKLEGSRIGLIGILCLFLGFFCMVALFFMGGLAPTRVREFMTEREKKLLDD